MSAFEEDPLSLETPLAGVSKDPEALPTPTKLLLRLDEVGAIGKIRPKSTTVRKN